jgi:hypothetical protein
MEHHLTMNVMASRLVLPGLEYKICGTETAMLRISKAFITHQADK